MEISIKQNSCSGLAGSCTMGEVTIEDGATKITIDYDRDELAAELIGGYKDLFDGDYNLFLQHLSVYLDCDDIETLRELKE